LLRDNQGPFRRWSGLLVEMFTFWG
jgi:hypothetical protein